MDGEDLLRLLERITAAAERIAVRLERLGTQHGAKARRPAPRGFETLEVDGVPAGGAEAHPLPAEVGTAQAADILGVSKDTVLEYRKRGLLRFRDTTPPGSSKPAFVYPLDDVVRLRTTYQTEEPSAKQPVEPARRPVKGRRRYKHLDIDD